MKTKEYEGFTTAQQILVALGVPANVVLFNHHKDKNPHFSKKGPGRKHSQGVK